MNRFTIFFLLVIFLNTHSSPQSNYKYCDMFFLDDHNGWILSNNGYLWKTTNEGADWMKIYDSRIDTSGKIIFVDEQNGWLISGNSLLHSIDGGLSWISQYEFPPFFGGYNIAFANDSIGFVTNSGGLYKSVDRGETWDFVTDTLQSIYDISFYKDSIGYLCFTNPSPWGITGIRYIYKTTDQGETWNRSYFEGGGLDITLYYDKIRCISKNECIVGAFDESIFGGSFSLTKTTDAGSTWETLYCWGWGGGGFDFEFISPQKGWSIGWLGLMYTTDGGMLWDTLQTFTNWDDRNTNFEFFNSEISYLINLNHIYFTNDGWVTYSFVDSIVTGLNEQQITATEFILEQNYPNPFNPSTNIKYEIAQSGQVSLKIYNVLGKEVETLINDFQSTGKYSLNFTANSSLSSGIYFYQLKAGNFIETKKMLLIK